MLRQINYEIISCQSTQYSWGKNASTTS